MKKETKIIIGLGVATLAYLVWKQNKKSFTGETAPCVKPLYPCPNLPGRCYTRTRGSILGMAPIGCFGNPNAPIPVPTPPTTIPISPRG
jgi:hypothetical protein